MRPTLGLPDEEHPVARIEIPGQGVQTRKGADAPLLPWLVNTARNYELLRFVEGTGHGVRLRPRDVKPSD